MTNLTGFQRNELIGREAFLEFMKIAAPNLKAEIKFSENQYACYDAYWIIEKDGVKKLSIVEIKIRNADYPDYILEEKKLDSMNSMCGAGNISCENTSLFYVNFCPSGTHIWNLKNVNRTIKPKNLYTNWTTSDTSNGKITKKVYYLPVSSAKSFDYVIDIEGISKKVL